jgi:hypothetical protein
MDRRLLLGGALAALVVLSGCSWVQQTPPATPTPSASASGDRVSIPVPLLRNHSRALANTSYAIEMEINISANDSAIDRSFAVRSDLVAERQRVELQGPRSVTDRFVGNGTIYTRLRANSSTGYDVRDFERFNVTFGTLHRRSISQGRLAGIYQYGEFDETGTVTRNGRTLTEYTLVDTGITRNATVESSSGRVLVDQQGVIRLARVDITGTRDGNEFFVQTTYRVTGVGDITVDEPGWTADARANERQNESTATATATPTG